jgi:transposase
MVALHSYPISNTYIAFVCAPNYENGSTAVLPDADSRGAALRLENLREALFAVETGEGISYSAVNTDSVGGVSVGCGQWYGARATELLQQIWKADPSAYTALDPDKRLLEGLARLTQAEYAALQQILGSESGIRIQNAWMEASLQAWTDRAAALGITDPEALLLSAALYQLRGETVAQRLIIEGADKNTLLNVIKDRDPDLYRTCCLLVE